MIDELNAELIGLRRDRLQFLREVRQATRNIEMHERRLKAERGKLHALNEVVCELDADIWQIIESEPFKRAEILQMMNTDPGDWTKDENEEGGL